MAGVRNFGGTTRKPQQGLQRLILLGTVRAACACGALVMSADRLQASSRFGTRGILVESQKVLLKHRRLRCSTVPFARPQNDNLTSLLNRRESRARAPRRIASRVQHGMQQIWADGTAYRFVFTGKILPPRFTQDRARKRGLDLILQLGRHWGQISVMRTEPPFCRGRGARLIRYMAPAGQIDT
jgi:hypothetical protein